MTESLERTEYVHCLPLNYVPNSVDTAMYPPGSPWKALKAGGVKDTEEFLLFQSSSLDAPSESHGNACPHIGLTTSFTNWPHPDYRTVTFLNEHTALRTRVDPNRGGIHALNQPDISSDYIYLHQREGFIIEREWSEEEAGEYGIGIEHLTVCFGSYPDKDLAARSRTNKEVLTHKATHHGCWIPNVVGVTILRDWVGTYEHVQCSGMEISKVAGIYNRSHPIKTKAPLIGSGETDYFDDVANARIGVHYSSIGNNKLTDDNNTTQYCTFLMETAYNDQEEKGYFKDVVQGFGDIEDEKIFEDEYTRRAINLRKENWLWNGLMIEFKAINQMGVVDGLFNEWPHDFHGNPEPVHSSIRIKQIIPVVQGMKQIGTADPGLGIGHRNTPLYETQPLSSTWGKQSQIYSYPRNNSSTLQNALIGEIPMTGKGKFGAGFLEYAP